MKYRVSIEFDVEPEYELLGAMPEDTKARILQRVRRQVGHMLDNLGEYSDMTTISRGPVGSVNVTPYAE